MSLKKYFVRKREQENIEAEEIFLDAEAVCSIEEKGKLEHPIKKRNFFFFYFLIIACLVVLLAKSSYLQIAKGSYYLDLAYGNRLRIYNIPAPRGIIYDRFNNPLVRNIPRFDLAVSIVDFLDNDPEVQKKILSEISKIVLVEGEGKEKKILAWQEIIEKSYGRTSQITLLKGIERSSALALEGVVSEWLGVRLEKKAQREYLNAEYFAHILGYTGQISPDELKEYVGYYANSQIGKTGLERQYEAAIRGRDGQEQIEVDSTGHTQGVIASINPKPGNGLLLNIDQGLQRKIQRSLTEMMEKLSSPRETLRRAAAVAVDPRDGGIRAIVSLPSFDNNLFVRGVSSQEMGVLKEDPARPFLNRATAGQYPSGSIIKPLIGAAALEEEIVNPYQQVDCRGAISIVNKYHPEITYRFLDWKVHGPTSLIKAIAESCNVYFYTVGGGFGGIEGLGIEKIKEYLEKFGLGQKTEIDLPYEEAGLIPDPEWKKKYKSDEEWYLGDTYHLSIGQGDMLVTPLQMAQAVAAIANGGILYQPQVVDKILDSKRNIVKDIPTETVDESVVSRKYLSFVQKGMRAAVLSGSASLLNALSVEAAGKTGTAQFGVADKTHAWFAGYAPYENPEIALVILVEGGGEGHEAAVPVAKEVFSWYFQ